MDNGFERYQKVWQKLALQLRELRDLSRTTAMIGSPAGEIFRIPKDTLHSISYSISVWHDEDNLLPVASIKRFFTRPWWGRIWVLKEITLPANAEFLCGSKIITRRRCSAALHAYCALRCVLAKKHPNRPLSSTPYQLKIVFELFQHKPPVMLSFWEIYIYSRFSLAALLRATCVGSINLHRHGHDGPHHLESTDPARKNICFIGSSSRSREKIGCYSRLFEIMQRNLHDGYGSSASAGLYVILSFCQTPEFQSNLPSWVPDWSRSGDRYATRCEK